MTDDGLGSRSDLEALQRSGRGKVVVLVLMLAVALGAAGWFFFVRKHGTGNKEEASKILVVARSRGYSLVLADVGFEAAEGTFEAWEQKAKEEVPELETTGIEAIMTLADRFGYGYVVFEKPQAIDFSKLDVDEVQEMPAHVQFAVLSAGDLAFPHVMTVNPKPSDVLRGSSVVILQALFQQQRLADALPANQSPSIEAVQLRDRLREGIDRIEQIPEAERMAEQIVGQVRRQLEEEERAEPKPGLVGAPLESGTPYALANGQLLDVTRGFQVVTRDAVRADLALDDVERLSIGAPGAEADARSKCEALAGGEIKVTESPRYWVAEDGAAVLVQTLDAGLRHYVLDPGALEPGKPGCGFTEKGKVSAASPGLHDPVIDGHGQVARLGSLAGQAVVSVVTAGQDDELVLGMLDFTELEDVAWLSERHLVAVGVGPDGPGVWLLDTQIPLTVLRLPGSVFENADAVHEVAVGKRGARPLVVVTAGDLPRKLYRLELPADLQELFLASTDYAAPAAAAADPAVPELAAPANDREARGLPQVTTLDPNRFVAVALTHEGSVRSPTVSLDGTRVAFELRGEAFDPTAPDDPEIASVAATGKGEGLAVLTRNALRDEDPRLTPDGAYVVFHTRVEIPRTDWVISAPRVVALGQ